MFPFPIPGNDYDNDSRFADNDNYRNPGVKYRFPDLCHIPATGYAGFYRFFTRNSSLEN